MIKLLISLLFCSSIQAMEVHISRIKGSVTVDGQIAKDGQPVKVGQKLQAKGATSFFQLKYSNGNQILIRDGILIVHKLSKRKNSVKLLKGLGFYSIDKKANGKFKVHTRYASFGVRGTKFFVQAGKKDSYLCVCEGSVIAKNKNSSKIVKKKEDLHMTRTSNFEVTIANETMWKMANSGFELFNKSAQ